MNLQKYKIKTEKILTTADEILLKNLKNKMKPKINMFGIVAC